MIRTPRRAEKQNRKGICPMEKKLWAMLLAVVLTAGLLPGTGAVPAASHVPAARRR